MYDYENIEGLKDNITVCRKYKEGNYIMCELIAHKGYVLHLIGDEGYIDEETGIFYPPVYSNKVIGSNKMEKELLNSYESIKEII